MENKTFLNGVNFINTVMARMTTGQTMSLPGYDRVLTEIVNPGLDLLSSSATIVNVQGNDVIQIRQGRRASGINGGVNEEVVVAERFLRIFEDYEDVDLGWLNFLKYRILLMARDALEAKYGNNCNEATEEKDALLYSTIMNNIQNIREEHPEYMYDPRCNGDCMDCPYFVIDGDDGDDDTV
ncbi:MAG: hypothetical protein MJ155_00580 [Candidatus Saccharibacteria bacterium]|nr:hypothetical protein [Candidatus Saccharibacteria bacterium]